ncbi:MAG: hypothetical protein RLZZ28_2697 [Bacteroidota bacterium]|jgi:hypothetical protein
MKNKQLSLVAIMAIAVTMLMTACSKNNSNESGVAPGQQQLSLYLTDGPGLFDNVFIDIKSVKVLVDTSKDTRKHDNDDWDRRGADDQKKDSSFVWESLNFAPGVYDILKFRNGADTVLASSGIVKGSIRMIKIEVGTKNSVVKDSITYPLTLPASALNYILIKLKGHECEEYVSNKRRLWLDFDVARSIITENNKFILRPVFHFFTVSATASVQGRVLPKEGFPVVTVYNETDTAYALPNKEGYFKLRGLKDGNYKVFINASNGYIDSTISNVIVKAPGETSVGVIQLRK